MTATGPVALLVPVKDLTRAKSRLAPLLSLAERRELAWRMLRGVLAALAAARHDGPRALVTSYAPAAALAREHGFMVIDEERQESESASVDAASAHLERAGVRGVLRIPLDLPHLGADDLAPVLRAAAEGCSAVLVPSRDGTGTNALYRAPPTLFPSRFGPDSLGLHQRAAQAAGASVRVLPVPGFALDIDDPADVAELVRRGTPGAALDYLHSLDIATRLKRMAREPA
jgi:2-phospho-L-lactate guanylyltransferase